VFCPRVAPDVSWSTVQRAEACGGRRGDGVWRPDRTSATATALSGRSLRSRKDRDKESSQPEDSPQQQRSDPLVGLLRAAVVSSQKAPTTSCCSRSTWLAYPGAVQESRDPVLPGVR